MSNSNERRHRWSPADETTLEEIINTGMRGELRKVIVEHRTNVRLTIEDAWSQTREISLNIF